MFTTDACALPLDLMVGGTCVFGMAGAVALSAILLLVTLGLMPFSPYRLSDLLRWPANGRRAAAGNADGRDASPSQVLPGPARAPVLAPDEDDDFDRDFGQIGRTIRVLIAVAAADGELDEAEVEVIRAVATGFFGYDISDHQIRRMYRKFGDNIDVEEEINRDLGSWHLRDDTVHQALVQGMVVVAAADGELDPGEKHVITAAAYALGLKGEETQALILEAEAMVSGYTEGAENAA